MPLKRLERGKMTSIFEYNKEEEDKKLYEAGIERGIEQGIHMGVEQTKKEMCFALLQKKVSIEEIAQIMKVDTVQINNWIKEMKK